VRVADLARAVASRLGLPPTDIVEAELAALVHDVGKLAIPTHLLDKPSALTQAERSLMQAHSVRGEEILLKATSLDLGREVRACHERWDGTGYPDGLAGADIPLASRIIGACDALDAMVSERAYRAALSLDEAMRRLRAGAGTQFDPDVVGAVLAVAADRFGRGPSQREQ
jgi:putative two-component system response regulator